MIHNFPPFGAVLAIFPPVSNIKFLHVLLHAIGPCFARSTFESLSFLLSGKKLTNCVRFCFVAFARCGRATSARTCNTISYVISFTVVGLPSIVFKILTRAAVQGCGINFNVTYLSVCPIAVSRNKNM